MVVKIIMSTNKHFTLSDRIDIQKHLKESYSFKAIGRDLNHDCTSVAKEIKNHITLRKIRSYGRYFNNCIPRLDCKYSYICDNPSCKDYEEEQCAKLLKPPYVCNGCKSLRSCQLKKAFYYANTAQKEYETLRWKSRSGITIDE